MQVYYWYPLNQCITYLSEVINAGAKQDPGIRQPDGGREESGFAIPAIEAAINIKKRDIGDDTRLAGNYYCRCNCNYNLLIFTTVNKHIKW